LQSADRDVLHEIDLLRGIRPHRGIVKLFAAWADPREKTVNFITELCSSSLLAYRRKHGRVSRRAAARWAGQILEALVHLHAHRPPVVHRDVKCENILVKSSSGAALKLADFGLATRLEHQSSRISSIGSSIGSSRISSRINSNNNNNMMLMVPVGTPEFMAPEMLRGEACDERVDVYSFGMCMLQLLSGEHPYRECRSIGQVCRKACRGIPPRALCGIGDTLAANLIRRCLLPVAQRPSSAELLSDPFLKCREGSQQIEAVSWARRPSRAPVLQPLARNLLEPGASSDAFVGSQEKPSSSIRDDAEGAAEPAATDKCETGKQQQRRQLDRKASFRVMGKVVDEHTLHLKLRIDAPSSGARAVVFPFDLRSDSPGGVAEEMVHALEYPESDLVHIANLIAEHVKELARIGELATCGGAHGHRILPCLANDAQKLQQSIVDCR
jgi:WNK lysine deficient protein kinase